MIRDRRGVMVAARSNMLAARYDVEVTEALAIEEGILLVHDMMLSQVIIESDRLAVVQATNSRSFHGGMGPIIQGASSLLSQFCSWKAEHLKRDYNKGAHEVAQFARNTRMSQTWIGTEPLMQLCSTIFF